MSIESKKTQDTLSTLESITGSKLTLGRLLLAIREADEVSQIDFAAKLKITKQHLCDIEHDRKSESPELAAQYARTLGYSEEQFIRLALQDMIDRKGLKFVVDINAANDPEGGTGGRKLI